MDGHEVHRVLGLDDGISSIRQVVFRHARHEFHEALKAFPDALFFRNQGIQGVDFRDKIANRPHVVQFLNHAEIREQIQEDTPERTIFMGDRESLDFPPKRILGERFQDLCFLPGSEQGIDFLVRAIPDIASRDRNEEMRGVDRMVAIEIAKEAEQGLQDRYGVDFAQVIRQEIVEFDPRSIEKALIQTKMRFLPHQDHEIRITARTDMGV